MFLVASLILAVGHGVLFAQTNVRIPEPNLHPPAQERYTVYLSPTGLDSNTGERDVPVSSFARAMEILKQRTRDTSGRLSCAFRFLPGEYTLESNFMQRAEDYSIAGTAGLRFLDLSIEGEGSCVLNASKIKVPAGHGVFTLCGRGITISNIAIMNSSEFGIRLGMPSYRCTNVLLHNVTIDGTYSHGIRIGDETSALADTTMLVRCTVRNTNLMNIRGERGQFGSAIKMFGARDVIIDSCLVERNWGEAVCVNNSQRVEVRGTTILDNWAPAVYCDVASDVRIHSTVFKSNADTTMFPRGRRGMVGVLLSSEAWDGSRTEYYTERIDIYNNTFVNMAGCLDIWEGTMGFLQRQIIRNVRFAHNTCIGMWTTQGNTSTAFVNCVYSSPFPGNRSLSNVRIASNIFSVSPSQVAPRLWVRMPADVIPAFTYPSNYWRSDVPGIGTTFKNVVNAQLPETEPASLLPNDTPALRGLVPTIPDIQSDARGLQRDADSTNVGAYEWKATSGVCENTLTPRGTSVLVLGRHITVGKSDSRLHVRVYSVNGLLLTEANIPAGETRDIVWDTPSAIVLID